jgi:hypothetical protein
MTRLDFADMTTEQHGQFCDWLRKLRDEGIIQNIEEKVSHEKISFQFEEVKPSRWYRIQKRKHGLWFWREVLA